MVTTLLQIPYGALIFLFILGGVFINDRLPPNNRGVVMVAFLLPSIAGAFGLRYVPSHHRVARLICYYVSRHHRQTCMLSQQPLLNTTSSSPVLSTRPGFCCSRCRRPTLPATRRR